MEDIIKVNTENMYEFCRALKDFEDNLERFSNGVQSLTGSLGSAMQGCSRYELVKDNIRGGAKRIEERLQQIHITAADIHDRADFLENFERGGEVSLRRHRDI